MKNQKKQRTPEEIAKDMRKLRKEQAELEKEMLAAKALQNSAQEVETPVETVEEAPAQEVEAPVETVEEAPAQEVEAPVETVEEAPAQEVETPVETVEETPAQEVETPVETVEETPAKEKTSEKKPKKERKSKDSGILLPILSAFAIVLLAGVLIITCVDNCAGNNQTPPVDTDTLTDTQQPVDTDKPTDTQKPVDTDKPIDTDSTVKFDMSAFKTSVVNIANQLTDEEDVSTNVDIFVENIGEEEIKELIEKYGELNVQKAIAEFLAFVPEIKMQQYVTNNGLNYNLNAEDDYNTLLLEADDAYKAYTGKNPDGALMSLEGYDIHKSNREAIKELIADTGDMALLGWYIIKTDGYDLMMKQINDTKVAEEYKEEVKLEIVNSEGSIKLLKLQMEEEANQKLIVMDDISMQYTESYQKFILNNYMYVVAAK